MSETENYGAIGDSRDTLDFTTLQTMSPDSQPSTSSYSGNPTTELSVIDSSQKRQGRRQISCELVGKKKARSEQDNAEELVKQPFSLEKELEEHYVYEGHVKGTSNVVLMCKHCNRRRKGKGKAKFNFMRHLQTNHPEKYKETRSSASSSKQQTLDENVECRRRKVPKISKTSCLQQTFNTAMLDLIAVDGLPFDLPNGVAFQNFVQILRPELNLQSRSSILRKLSEEIDSKIIPTLTKLIKNVPKKGLHISLDLWTSRSQEAVLGIKAHFINQAWELISKTIAFSVFPERHTGENIFDKVQEILRLRQISLDDIGVVMADNAANITKAFNMTDVLNSSWRMVTNMEEQEESETEDEAGELIESINSDDEVGIREETNTAPVTVIPSASALADEILMEGTWKRLRCSAHTLQLAINSALKKDEKAKTLIKSVEKTITFFRRSPHWYAKLKEITKKTLIVPGKTRWNSLLYAIDRLLEDNILATVKELIQMYNTTLGSRSKKRLVVELDAMQLTSLASLLRPLAIATDKLQSNDVTSSFVMLSIVNSFAAIRSVLPGSFSVLKQELLKQIQERFRGFLNESTFIMATVLHPRMKMRLFQSRFASVITNELHLPAETMVKDIIQGEYDVHCTSEFHTDDSVALHSDERSQRETSNVEAAVPQFTDPRPIEKDNFFQFLDQLCPLSSGPQKKTELDLYLEQPAEEIDALKYWKANEQRFPVLSKLARIYLAVPATSGDMERLFSIAGSLKRSRRSRMKIEVVEKLLLYREHRIDSLRNSLL